MTKKWQWSDPQIWVPLLTAIIASIIGPIIVLSYQGFFNNPSEDKIPPTINVPQSPVKAEADTSSGTTVSYTVSATDDMDGTITPSCEPSSGSTFDIGNTIVTCTAEDKAGNSAGEKQFTIAVVQEHECHPSYPDNCISPPPSDLNCSDAGVPTNLEVAGSDPHGFDPDNDGVGCESQASTCDTSYPDDCIPPPPPNLNCGDPGIPQNFRVLSSDPHGFDGDNDGIGCPSVSN